MTTRDPHLTLRALDRLPPEDARELDSLLADDARLAAELRATEETISALWYAASPLLPAPAGSFEKIQARLHPLRQRHLKASAIAISGWAAALALVAVLMARQEPANPAALASNLPPASAAPLPVVASKKASAARLGNDEPQRKLRETVLALQQNLRTARSESAGPRVRALRSPNASASAISDDPSRDLRDLISAALTENLARLTETPTTLTVETGWTPEAFAALPADSLIRHRSFPVENYFNFGLLRAENGDFYDPSTHLLWTPAADGGGYLGKLAAAGQDLTIFKLPPTGSLPEVLGKTQNPDPSGYLVQGAAAGEATLIIGNLPTTDPASQLLASVDGGATTFFLNNGVIMPGPQGLGFASFAMGDSLNTINSLNSGTREMSIYQMASDGSTTLILTTEPDAGGE